MADAHPRNRTPAGQPTGGEFATEAKQAPYGLDLSDGGPPAGAADPDRPETLTPTQRHLVRRLSVDTPSSLRHAVYRAVGYRPGVGDSGLDDARCALLHRDQVDQTPGWDTEAYVTLSRPWRQATGQRLHPDDPDDLDVTSSSSVDSDGLADRLWPVADSGRADEMALADVPASQARLTEMFGRSD